MVYVVFLPASSSQAQNSFETPYSLNDKLLLLVKSTFRILTEKGFMLRSFFSLYF